MKKLVLLSLLISPCVPRDDVSAQWMSATHPDAHAIDCFATFREPGFGINYVFGGTDDNGLFFTPDLGGFWVEENLGLMNKRITAVGFNQSIMLAGAFGGGIFTSSDSGGTWVEKNDGIPFRDWWGTSGRITWGLAALGDVLFATTDLGVYRSTDGGGHWTLGAPGSFGPIAVMGSRVFAFNESSLFASGDTGASWAGVSYVSISRPSALMAFGGDLYAGTVLGPGVIRSTDSGATWTPAGDGLEGHTYVLALASMGDTLIAGCGDYGGVAAGGAFISVDSGAHWTAAGLSGIRVFSLDVQGPTVVAATSEGIARTGDGGASWSWSATSFWPDYPTCVAHDGSILLAGTYGSGAFKSADGGENWIPVRSGMTVREINALAIAGSDFYAAADGGVHRTAIGAEILWSPLYWERVNSGLTNTTISSIALSPDTHSLFAGSLGGGVFVSTDRGSAWSPVNNGLTDDSVCSLAFHEGALYAGTSGGGIFRSSDEGGSWVLCNPGMEDNAVLAFGETGHDLFAGMRGGGLFVSSDDGASWEFVDSSLAGRSVTCIAAADSALFAGTSDGVFMIRRNVPGWEATECGLQGIDIHALTVNSGQLLASTPSAMFRRPVSELTALDDPRDERPRSAALLRNYPNPFNPSTTISFYLPERSEVSLVIFDMLGREVALLAEGQFRAGWQSVVWDAKRSAGGVYVCRLQAGPLTKSLKLILLR